MRSSQISKNPTFRKSNFVLIWLLHRASLESCYKIEKISSALLGYYLILIVIFFTSSLSLPLKSSEILLWSIHFLEQSEICVEQRQVLPKACSKSKFLESIGFHRYNSTKYTVLIHMPIAYPVLRRNMWPKILFAILKYWHFLTTFSLVSDYISSYISST